MPKSNHCASLKSLPEGLTISEVALRLGLGYQRCRTVIRESRYKSTDGRTMAQIKRRKIDPDSVDWTLSNIEIARKSGLSRERVRAIRERLGKAKVEARGRKRCP